jgi:hypothetical protein
MASRITNPLLFEEADRGFVVLHGNDLVKIRFTARQRFQLHSLQIETLFTASWRPTLQAEIRPVNMHFCSTRRKATANQAHVSWCS